MAVPKVVIVGRPNVGKSSVFNWLAGIRLAIVEDRPGVTRDRVDYLTDHEGRYFELVDTGGIGIEDEDNLTKHIEDQIQTAIDSAAVILFVVDTRAGLMPLDEEVGRRLRDVEVPVLCIANKTDDEKMDVQTTDFYRLGRGKIVPVSTKQNRNRTVLLNMIVERLPPESEGEGPETEPEMKVAIVGRRNVGKSTFVNTLAQAERMIVSEIPGTTRDSVDVRFELDGKAFVAIDTPGVRKKKSLANDIEFYGLIRAQKSIRRADVVLMFFDSTQTISQVDKKLMEEIQDHSKPCIFVINKWDLGLEKAMSVERWSKYLEVSFKSMRHVPMAFITAKDSQNIKQLINLAQSIFKQARERVSTGILNRVLAEAVKANPPHIAKNRTPKLFFATQVATEPPTIVVKVNNPELFSPAWERYLLGKFREELPFKEVPIRLYFRGKTKEDEDA